MKRFFALLLAVLMVLSLTACVANNNAAQTTDTQTEALSPEAAAEEAAAKTKDTTSLSDIIRVPFGYLLDWLYTFTNNYGLALILFSLIVKLVLLPMSVKSKKSMLKMSRLSPQVKALEAKYGDDKQKYQLAVQQMYKEEGVSAGSMPTYLSVVLTAPAAQPAMDSTSTAARTQIRIFFFIVFLQMWWGCASGQREKTTLPYGTGSK